jgi:hypothetical protein
MIISGTANVSCGLGGQFATVLQLPAVARRSKERIRRLEIPGRRDEHAAYPGAISQTTS